MEGTSLERWQSVWAAPLIKPAATKVVSYPRSLRRLEVASELRVSGGCRDHTFQNFGHARPYTPFCAPPSVLASDDCY
jgi:hypothetical protein